jgi:hypothetical protein
MSTNNGLGKIQDEITRHLEAFYPPIHHIPTLASLLMTDVVEPAIRAERERCAQVCDALSDDLHRQYKGIAPHAPNNPSRADTFVEGKSDGADACAAAIRALD